MTFDLADFVVDLPPLVFFVLLFDAEGGQALFGSGLFFFQGVSIMPETFLFGGVGFDLIFQLLFFELGFGPVFGEGLELIFRAGGLGAKLEERLK